MEDCLFCRIVGKKIATKVLFEGENVLAFPDINPAAEVHIVIVPKQHIGGLQDLGFKHQVILTEIFQAVNQLVKDNDLTEKAYRVGINGGKAQHVPHLHFHLLGGQWKKFI